MTPKEAVDNGALALFGEKYGDEVRVFLWEMKKIVIFQQNYVEELMWKIQEILENLKIISQSSIAAGVRRVEALRDKQLQDYFKNKEKQTE